MVYSLLTRAERKAYLKLKQMKLKNKTPSIISNNCVGGVIAHDLGLQFNSPFVNIGFTGSNYIKVLKNLKHYLSLSPTLLNKEKNVDNNLFPLVELGDLDFLFAHEDSAEEALKKWNKRKIRVDFDNLFVVMCEAYECTYEDLKEFDALPYKNKVMFTCKPYPEFKSVYYFDEFAGQDEVGVLTNFKEGFWRRRWIDKFDYVSFLNKNVILK